MTAKVPKLPPPMVVRAVEGVRSGLQNLNRRTVPAPIAMLEMVTGAWLSQAISVAAKLGIADALRGGPRSVVEVAREVGAHPESLGRLVRALAQHGVFELCADGKIAQSALSDCLRRDAGTSMRDYALFVGSREHREHWSALESSVRTGQTAVPALRGVDFFEYLERADELAQVFHGAMSGISDLAKHAVLAVYDFSSFGTIVDVGGGHGRFLSAILQRSPGARGVLFDLPEVTREAAKVLLDEGVSERCRIESGSFFEGVPSGGDAYILKHIVHDWEDAKAHVILGHVRRAISATGKLILVELVVPESNGPHAGKLVDLEMLVTVGGKERTHNQFQELLASAGFRLSRIVQTASPVSVVEADPV